MSKTPLSKLPRWLKFPLRGLMLVTACVATIAAICAFGWGVVWLCGAVFGLVGPKAIIAVAALIAVYIFLYWLGSEW